MLGVSDGSFAGSPARHPQKIIGIEWTKNQRVDFSINIRFTSADIPGISPGSREKGKDRDRECAIGGITMKEESRTFPGPAGKIELVNDKSAFIQIKFSSPDGRV